jgi:Spy/CpxP family protein refolding chaperone
VNASEFSHLIKHKEHPMMSKLTKLTLAATVLAFAVPFSLHAAAPATAPEAAPPAPNPFHGKPPVFDAEHLPAHLQALNLSPEQRTKIADLLKTQSAALHDRFKAGMGTHQALRKLVLSADYSDEKAKVLIEEAAKSANEAALAHAHMDHEIYQLLTPQQQQQWQASIGDFEKHHPKPN